MYGGNQGQTLFSDLWQYNLNSNIWDKIQLAEKLSNLREDNLKNCTMCDECQACDFRPDRRINCLTCHECYHNETDLLADKFNNLNCGLCEECDEGFFK